MVYGFVFIKNGTLSSLPSQVSYQVCAPIFQHNQVPLGTSSGLVCLQSWTVASRQWVENPEMKNEHLKEERNSSSHGTRTSQARTSFKCCEIKLKQYKVEEVLLSRLCCRSESICILINERKFTRKNKHKFGLQLDSQNKCRNYCICLLCFLLFGAFPTCSDLWLYLKIPFHHVIIDPTLSLISRSAFTSWASAPNCNSSSTLLECTNCACSDTYELWHDRQCSQPKVSNRWVGQ